MKEYKMYEEAKTCSYMGQTFKSGEEICEADRCMMCRDGDWEEEPVA